MTQVLNEKVLVVGLGGRGRAACRLLRRNGQPVVGIDSADTPELRVTAQELRELGVEVSLGVTSVPYDRLKLAVLSPGIPLGGSLVQELRVRKVPTISELELGFQHASCLGIAVGGTNGKGTTAGLIERMLIKNQRKTLICGQRSSPICSGVADSNQLDYLILQVSAPQLETTDVFRPAVAVLLNLAHPEPDRYGTPDDYVRACARLFANQQLFDWAIVQSQALQRLRRLNLPIPSKVITFSAADQTADLHLDRGLLVSRMPNWPGPLLDLAQCQLRGPHNAENIMAALAVGHALRLPLESMLEPLKTSVPRPHCCEVVAEIAGVQYVNDSKATNLDSLCQALQAVRPGSGDQPNVWLIAGGRDQCLDFHDLGPVISQRVKRAILIGESGERLRAAWGLFTPCAVAGSLLEAIAEAATNATSGDVVLLSPACSSFDQFQNYQQRGEVFCQAVKSIGRGAHSEHPNISGKTH